MHALAHHRRHTRALHRVMHPAPAGLSNLLHHVHLFAIERMGRAQLAGQLQATVMHVHRKDLLAAGNLRRHDRTQTHRTAAVHRDAGTERRLQAIEHRACTGLDTAAQRPQQSQVHLLVHLHHVALVGHHMAAKGRLAKEGM